MTRLKLYSFIIPTLIISLFSCSEAIEKQAEKKEISSKESLEKVNRYLVRTESEEIENYIRRHNWSMEESGSGLRFWVYEKGEGTKAEKGMIAKLNYKTWLLDGTLIYSSDELGKKEFKIGKGGVESGLEEAIVMMHAGDKAKLVIPSHLAFGLLGDNNKIPPRSSVVYDIELISLK